MFGEVLEISLIDGEQGHVVMDATSRNPHVVLGAWPSAILCTAGETSPEFRYFWVERDHRLCFDPCVKGVARRDSPTAHLCPLCEFSDGHEGKPCLIANEMVGDPRFSASFDEYRRDIGVDDEIRHGVSAEVGVATVTEVGEEIFEFLVGRPKVGREFLYVFDGSRSLRNRELSKCHVSNWSEGMGNGFAGHGQPPVPNIV